MSMSVDGLISGMDTTTLISQLMQAEAGPQTALKTRLSTSQTAASAYRTVNSGFAVRPRRGRGRDEGRCLDAVKASSSSTAVTAAAVNGATTGSLTFAVKSTAKAHAIVSRRPTGPRPRMPTA